MRRTAIALAALLVLTAAVGVIGCEGGERAAAPEDPSEGTPQPSPPVVATASPTTTSAEPTPPPPTPGPSPTSAQPGLVLHLTEPDDGSQVGTRIFEYGGRTTPGAVVTVLVNGEIAIADVTEEGEFSVKVTLEEGPNHIEVIASDSNGNEEYSSVTVMYVP